MITLVPLMHDLKSLLSLLITGFRTESLDFGPTNPLCTFYISKCHCCLIRHDIKSVQRQQKAMQFYPLNKHTPTTDIYNDTSIFSELTYIFAIIFNLSFPKLLNIGSWCSFEWINLKLTRDVQKFCLCNNHSLIIKTKHKS